MPDAFAERPSAQQVYRRAMALLKESLFNHPSVWIAAIILFIATDIASVSSQGHFYAMSILMARLVFDLWIVCAVYRAMIGSQSPIWSLDGNFWLYFAAALILGSAVLAIKLASDRLLYFFIRLLTPTPAAAHAVWLVASAVLMILIGLSVLRIAFWLPALAVGGAQRGIVAAWRRVSGLMLPLVMAFLAAIMPLFAAHYLLTRWLQGGVPSAPARFALTGINGAISGVLLLAIASVISATYTLTEQRTG